MEADMMMMMMMFIFGGGGGYKSYQKWQALYSGQFFGVENPIEIPRRFQMRAI